MEYKDIRKLDIQLKKTQKTKIQTNTHIQKKPQNPTTRFISFQLKRNSYPHCNNILEI